MIHSKSLCVKSRNTPCQPRTKRVVLGHKGKPVTTLALDTMTATLTKPAKVKLPQLKETMQQRMEQLAAKLADAREQRKIWEAAEAALVDQLIEAHTAGVAPTKFTTAGWSFSFQQGRQTVQYPESLTAQIKDMQAAAVVAGVTTVKIGKPFWKVVPAKEAG